MDEATSSRCYESLYSKALPPCNVNSLATFAIDADRWLLLAASSDCHLHGVVLCRRDGPHFVPTDEFTLSLAAALPSSCHEPFLQSSRVELCAFAAGPLSTGGSGQYAVACHLVACDAFSVGQHCCTAVYSLRIEHTVHSAPTGDQRAAAAEHWAKLHLLWHSAVASGDEAQRCIVASFSLVAGSAAHGAAAMRPMSHAQTLLLAFLADRSTLLFAVQHDLTVQQLSVVAGVFPEFAIAPDGPVLKCSMRVSSQIAPDVLQTDGTLCIPDKDESETTSCNRLIRITAVGCSTGHLNVSLVDLAKGLLLRRCNYSFDTPISVLHLVEMPAAMSATLYGQRAKCRQKNEQCSPGRKTSSDCHNRSNSTQCIDAYLFLAPALGEYAGFWRTTLCTCDQCQSKVQRDNVNDTSFSSSDGVQCVDEALHATQRVEHFWRKQIGFKETFDHDVMTAGLCCVDPGASGSACCFTCITGTYDKAVLLNEVHCEIDANSGQLQWKRTNFHRTWLQSEIMAVDHLEHGLYVILTALSLHVIRWK